MLTWELSSVCWHPDMKMNECIRVEVQHGLAFCMARSEMTASPSHRYAYVLTADFQATSGRTWSSLSRCACQEHPANYFKSITIFFTCQVAIKMNMEFNLDRLSQKNGMSLEDISIFSGKPQTLRKFFTTARVHFESWLDLLRQVPAQPHQSHRLEETRGAMPPCSHGDRESIHMLSITSNLTGGTEDTHLLVLM